MYTYTYVCIYKHAHIHTCTYMSTCLYVCLHTHVYMCIHVDICIHTCTCIFICSYVHICVCMYVHMHFFTHSKLMDQLPNQVRLSFNACPLRVKSSLTFSRSSLFTCSISYGIFCGRSCFGPRGAYLCSHLLRFLILKFPNRRILKQL